jgi:hypothetical protein
VGGKRGAILSSSLCSLCLFGDLCGKPWVFL